MNSPQSHTCFGLSVATKVMNASLQPPPGDTHEQEAWFESTPLSENTIHEAVKTWSFLIMSCVYVPRVEGLQGTWRCSEGVFVFLVVWVAG